jgi:hypothetical protein
LAIGRRASRTWVAVPAGRAGVEHVAVDEVDHRSVGAQDRHRSLGDDLHHALQVIARGGDRLLGSQDQRQPLLAIEMRARHLASFNQDAARPQRMTTRKIMPPLSAAIRSA